ncbi:MAG TPA: lecithin retinol acyltransferase family protein [Candidatus Cloacimonadota bacterium]|nr:lecithin retinol acyltransferase family protein [Candidatus Cloacimonadota bacterium]HPK40839.1 lecithin retinol acyltransferase family protein [Candidatus Cloacimonadota bacterium]
MKSKNNVPDLGVQGFSLFKNKSQWKYDNPKFGDHIRVKRWDTFTPYYNHGIYVNDDEVIHFSTTKIGLRQEIIVSSLSEFLNGGNVEVRLYNEKEKQQINRPEQIVKNAQLYIGKKKVQLFRNADGYKFAQNCTFMK